MNWSQILENTLYFVALINPASKILFLSSRTTACSTKELLAISSRSSLVAWVILAILTSAGNFVLIRIFHVEIYSLSVAGGIILFIVGFIAIRNGSFFEISTKTQNICDVSIVPLATPLIAGPGTMTAAISFASIHGLVVTLICISLAIAINLIFMLLSFHIKNILEKFHAMGPMICITGLIVTAVATQMIFTGMTLWLKTAF
jgi:multiple antibiotic resistance protein